MQFYTIANTAFSLSNANPKKSPLVHKVNVYADWCKKYAKAVKELPKMGADKSQYYDKELFFDAVIIDEAQDLASEWIDTLLGLLRDKEHGFARVFYDPAQRLYAKRDGIENVQVKA